MIWLILFLGLILRLVNLNQSLWLDEATQVLLSKDSLGSIIFQRGADFHPPLSYILLHFWIFFGSSEIWLRLLSVIFGVFTIWVVYKLACEIFDNKIGILSAFFISIAPYHIYYSQEIRMYAEATFFACVSMYYFYKISKKQKTIDSLRYIIFSAALIYTHYDGFFLVFAQFVYLIFLKRFLLQAFIKRSFFVFLLFLPWLPQFLIQLRGGVNIDQYLPGWKDILSVSFYKAIPLTFFKFSLGRIDFNNLFFYILIATLVLLVSGYVLYQGVRAAKDPGAKLMIFWLFIPLIIVLFVSFKIPINQPFRVLYTLPAYYILLSLGIYSLKKFKKIFLLVIICISVIGLGLYYFYPVYWREDWRGASEFISKKANQQVLGFFAWPEPFSPYKYYLPGNSAVGVVKDFPASKDELEKTLKIIDGKNGVYLFEYLQVLSDPNRFIQQILENKGFKKVNVYDFRGVGFVDYFVKNE